MPTMTKTKPARTSAKPARSRMTLAETMSALEKAGTAQTRKTYLRHGAKEPMFGVSFATLKTLVKRIGVDHELALALWDTGNFDARNPRGEDRRPRADDACRPRPLGARCRGRADVRRLRRDARRRGAARREAGRRRGSRRRASTRRGAGWALVGATGEARRDDARRWFLERLAEIEKTIHSAPNASARR